MEIVEIRKNGGGEKQMKRYGIFLTIPLVIIIIIVSLLGSRWAETLQAQKIVIDGARILPVKYINSLAGVKSGLALNEINLYGIRENLLGEPFVRSACVNRRYPDAITIRISERVPIASINLKQLRYLDDEAMVLPYIETAVKLDLPIINGISGIESSETGTRIDSREIDEAIKILQTALAVDSSVYRFISEINMKNGDDVLLYSTEGAIPVLLGRGNYGKKLMMLQTFWNNYVRSPNANRLRQVDLRFNDQLIVKWETES